MPIVDNNVASGLQENGRFRVGRTNVDSGQLVEQGVNLPWPSDPAMSYMYYDCTVGVMLDSGIVVHNRLPQVNNLPDTLAMTDLDDPNMDRVTGFGVNLQCRDQYADIVQRMGHARYWFRIWGQAMRIGHQVPIPRIKTIGGVPTVPYDRNPQWAFNAITPGGNYGGVILWRAAWSLWYTLASPPRGGTLPAADPSALIRGTVKPPAQMQAPFSQADDRAAGAAPAATRQFTVDATPKRR